MKNTSDKQSDKTEKTAASVGIDGTTLIKDGWFMEKSSLWPGQAMGLQVDSILHHQRSALQDILVFKSTHYGNVLVLDGVIQCTERDEFAYQEMITHLPMFAHKAPRRVLVVGGGDGGVVREVLAHDCVRAVTLCEIDDAVLATTRRFLPSMSAALDDPRVSIVHEDGAQFVARGAEGVFDVIITDSSDPIGPAAALFEEPFYRAMRRALAPGGLLCTQGECMWLHAALIRPLMASCRGLFPVVEYAFTSIPTYPSGQIGFVICAVDAECDVVNTARVPPKELQLKLKYYNADVHRAAFVLPQFARRELGLVED